MEKKDLRIVYMGTPDFAVESLKRLVEGGYNVVGVITMPDKPMGRHGSVLQPSPVKQYAVSQGLRVLQPERLKDEAFVEALRAWNADLQIVDADGNPIAGLYGAGELVGGSQGDQVVSLLGWSITSGRYVGLMLGQSLK